MRRAVSGGGPRGPSGSKVRHGGFSRCNFVWASVGIAVRPRLGRGREKEGLEQDVEPLLVQAKRSAVSERSWADYRGGGWSLAWRRLWQSAPARTLFSWKEAPLSRCMCLGITPRPMWRFDVVQSGGRTLRIETYGRSLRGEDTFPKSICHFNFICRREYSLFFLRAHPCLLSLLSPLMLHLFGVDGARKAFQMKIYARRLFKMKRKECPCCTRKVFVDDLLQSLDRSWNRS